MSTLVWLDDQYGIVRSRDLNRLLSRICRRLGSVAYGAALETELDASDAQEFIDYPWQIFLMKSERPNAFSPGAGVIVITSGMLHQTRTEAQLAAVVSHEMAHQILGHTRKALRKAHESKKEQPEYSYDLREEIDADTLGLKIMHVGRYDLTHALQALSIGYSPVRGHTSGIPEDWLSIRMSNLHQRIDGYGNYLPATQTTREFTRVRKHLGS
jgi:Zn-dependent protease with chaperone function